MSDDFFLLANLHSLAQQNGNGIAPELMLQMSEEASQNVQGAEIVKLAALHERPFRTKSFRSSRQEATVINFPPTRWQRNGSQGGG